jgi:hypothetical protein
VVDATLEPGRERAFQQPALLLEARGQSGSYGTTTVIERLQFDLNVSHGSCGI